ncbi:large conductance mechanosensitive channel protein MscL [soil metagenome]
MEDLWRGFKAFAIKGNLVDLAVAFILALAFIAVLTSFLDDIIWPIIGGIVSDRSFAALTFEFLGADVRYGNFLTEIIYFLMIAIILFAVVTAYSRFREAEITTKRCPYCVTEIPLAASRCPNCTSPLEEPTG